MKLELGLLFIGGIAMTAGCDSSAHKQRSFAQDLDFLRKHTKILVLSGESEGAKVAVAPAYQGRVLTSTASGDDSPGFGWINRELIAGGRFVEHMNPFGGEDRFWLGPEGGQFSIFFKKGDPFDLEHWQTPAPIDTDPFELVSSSESEAVFEKDMNLVNYSGTEFNLKVSRTIRLLPAGAAEDKLGVEPGSSIRTVAYESENKVTNTGSAPWKKETGLLSIWILGMYNPSPETTVVIPFKEGPEDKLGPMVNDAYFGKVPDDRLVISDGVMYFSGDGKYRSKIGLSPDRAKPVLGSYDAAGKALTIVQYTKPEDADGYVNSMWEIQEEPYGGDVVNSYNDGPPEPGAKPLGPFYELETSSPALDLKPGETATHVHRTFHMTGNEQDLDAVARRALGVGLDDIKTAF